eukprot:g676.t1
MVKGIGNNLKKKASTSNRSKKNPNTKVTPKNKEAENDSTDTNVKTVDDAIDTHVENVNDTINTHAETIKDGKGGEITIKDGKGGEIYEMMIHLLQALLTIYSVINYWYHYMPNLDGKDARTQILCRATHMSMMPLFKPVSISMWPALMPLIQLLHWTLHKDKDLLNYQDFVLPGTQPFQFNWLSWLYVYLVGICWCVYMVATLVYWPLILMSSWILIPLVYAIPFVCLHLPVQVLNGRWACCRCRLLCWKQSGVRKLVGSWGEKRKVAEHFGISEYELEKRARDANAESDSSVGMLTLKALTVLYLVLTVTSMYFLPVYYGQIDVYNDMVNAFQMEFGFVPVFEFVTIHFDFQFLFRWPDTLRIDFQIVLFFSISLIIFERMVAIVKVIDEDMQRKCPVQRKDFQKAIWMVRVPYWLGESYYKLFEMGWEILVMVYGLVACMLYYLPYRGLYKCFKSETYPFREVDLGAIEKGLMIGFYDAVGKSGWYIILKKVFDGKSKDELKTLIGSGLSEKAFYTYLKNNCEKEEIDLSEHYLT